METTPSQPQLTATNITFPSQAQLSSANILLPSHSNNMIMAILCTLFCCLVGGIIAIVQSSRSNDLYDCALMTSDSGVKQSLFMESEKKNSSARTWIIISIAFGVISDVVLIILITAGILSLDDLFDDIF